MQLLQTGDENLLLVVYASMKSDSLSTIFDFRSKRLIMFPAVCNYTNQNRSFEWLALSAALAAWTSVNSVFHQTKPEHNTALKLPNIYSETYWIKSNFTFN